MAKRGETLWPLALLLLLMIPGVAAFGISPATYDATGAGERSYDLRIINDAHESITLRIVADGEVRSMLFPSRSIVELTPEMGEVVVPIRIAVPDNQLPGSYAGGIIVEQDPSTVSQEGFIRAIPAVRQRVSIRIPSEGKHLSARVLTSAGIVDEPLDITVAVRSVGTLAIDSLSTRVEIRGPTGTVLETLSAPATDLGPGEEQNLVVRWVPESTGTYSARSIISFDGLSTTADRGFTVGSLELAVLEPLFGPFSLGDVARIDLPVRSAWNERIPGVFARVRVLQQGIQVDEFTTLSSEVPPLGDAVLTGYWNTAGRAPGSYALAVEAFYGGGSTKEEFPVTIGLDSVDTQQKTSWQEWVFVAAGIVALLLGAFVLAKRLIRKRN